MKLTIGSKGENGSLAVRTKKVELRRLFGLLFVISVVPPIVWGLCTHVAQAEDREERTVGDIGERAAPAAAAVTADPQEPSLSEKASTTRNLDRGAPLTPSELYARASNAESLRAERIRMAERALSLALASDPVGAPAEPVLLAQADSPAAAPADLPADDDDDEEDDAEPVDLSAIAPAILVAPQVSAVGATSSTIGGGSRSSSQPGAGGSANGAGTSTESAEPAPGAVTDLRSLGQPAEDQPGSVGPRSAPATSVANPAQETSGAAETRRRARTALHSAAAQAAVAMVSDAPYRNSLSGQERFTAPGNAAANEIAAIGGGLDRVSETLSFIPGLHLSNVSVFSGFSSNGISNQQNSFIDVGGDYDFGASATVAFLRNWRRTNLRLNYTPVHRRRARFGEWNSTDHRLSISSGHQLSRRWSIGSAVSAANSGLEAFWFELPVFSQVENPPASFDELFRMVEAGELTDDQFASVLTGAPVVEDEGGQGFDLSRVLNVSASANAAYAYSPRLSFSVSGSISDTRLLEDPLIGRRISVGGRQNINGLSQASLSGSASYSLDRRTNLNTGYTQSQQLSSVFDNTMRNVYIGFGRRFGRSWNIGANVGVGAVSWGTVPGGALENSLLAGGLNLNNPMRMTWTAGGNIGYRVRAHRFQFSAGRTAGDNFGLGSQSSMNASGGWSWSTRDSVWSAGASASYIKSMAGFGLSGDNSILTRSIGGSLSRRVTSTTAVQTSYYFGEFSSPFRGLFVNNSIHRVQASFVWSPAQLR